MNDIKWAIDINNPDTWESVDYYNRLDDVNMRVIKGNKIDLKGKAITNKHIEKQSKEDISNMKEYQEFMDLLR